VNQARVGHLYGVVSLALITGLIADTYFRSMHVPHISGAVFLLLYFGATLLSAGAGKLASRWWFIETGCLVVLMILVWIGEFFFENKL
jgi:NADH:ubiquinone oxidoreductase subunit 6 (subunit J)